jgi:hypothetical protein
MGPSTCGGFAPAAALSTALVDAAIVMSEQSDTRIVSGQATGHTLSESGDEVTPNTSRRASSRRTSRGSRRATAVDAVEQKIITDEAAIRREQEEKKTLVEPSVTAATSASPSGANSRVRHAQLRPAVESSGGADACTDPACKLLEEDPGLKGLEAEYRDLEHRILEAELKRNALKEKVEGMGLFRRSVQDLLTLPAVEEAANLADCFATAVTNVSVAAYDALDAAILCEPSVNKNTEPKPSTHDVTKKAARE